MIKYLTFQHCRYTLQLQIANQLCQKRKLLSLLSKQDLYCYRNSNQKPGNSSAFLSGSTTIQKSVSPIIIDEIFVFFVLLLPPQWRCEHTLHSTLWSWNDVWLLKSELRHGAVKRGRRVGARCWTQLSWYHRLYFWTVFQWFLGHFSVPQQWHRRSPIFIATYRFSECRWECHFNNSFSRKKSSFWLFRG